MTTTPAETLILILIIALCTLATRAVPFLLFPPGRPTPGYIRYLGGVLPYAIIGMLIVYCLREVRPLEGSHGLPELLGVLVTAGLFLWKKNTLLAIAAGTVLYMVLVQLVFV